MLTALLEVGGLECAVEGEGESGAQRGLVEAAERAGRTLTVWFT